MSIAHKCFDCRTCTKCFSPNCSTYLPPNEIKESIENGWHVRRCYNCGHILEKYESLELLRKNNKL